ncbi:MAG: 1-acyl-sn-glycerol-3-phosphate acyltransferase [Pirellulales bacterium]|nr:1-acyl-sn-glycerol-3-phosphate acyltransferase [Pirellulales bacterium]
MSTTVALNIILAIVAIIALVFVVWWKRSPLTLKQLFLWSCNYMIARLIWRTRIIGQLPVQAGHGAVIVANHRSSVDPAFIQTCIRRVVYWMVAREYCQAPYIGALLRALQVIPVGRGGIDTAATKRAIRLAQAGGIVGMFPEGRINRTDQLLLPGRPGAALVALRARVPIIPVFIFDAPYNGTALGPLFMRSKVRVKIGRPMDLSSYFGREREPGVLLEITKRAMHEMAVLAGKPGFEPQMAGARWMPRQNATLGGGHASSNGDATANHRQPSKLI